MRIKPAEPTIENSPALQYWVSQGNKFRAREKVYMNKTQSDLEFCDFQASKPQLPVIGLAASAVGDSSFSGPAH
jgi:hypothetical protein